MSFLVLLSSVTCSLVLFFIYLIFACVNCVSLLIYREKKKSVSPKQVYNEYDESSLDSFSASKKSKNDDEWLSKGESKSSKSSKPGLKTKETTEKNANNQSLIEKTSNKTIIARNESPDSSQSEIIVTEVKDQFDELKENSPVVVPKPRTYQRKLLPTKNEEIIARSSLFHETPVTPKRGRTGALLNAAKEEIEKKRQQESEIDKFTSSLNLDTQDLGDESEKIIVDDDEEVFERKRVIPPLPVGRRPIHGKKRGGGTGPEPLNISTKKASLSTEEANNTPLVNGVGRRINAPRRSARDSTETRVEPSTSSSGRGKKDVNMMPCPLCSLPFPQKEIEEHAATCGEDMFPQTLQPKLSRITCEFCDQVVPLNTEYDAHAKNCIAKKST